MLWMMTHWSRGYHVWCTYVRQVHILVYAVQYSTVQYSTVQYSTVQYSTRQYNNTVQYVFVKYPCCLTFPALMSHSTAVPSMNPESSTCCWRFKSMHVTAPALPVSVCRCSSLWRSWRCNVPHTRIVPSSDPVDNDCICYTTVCYAP